MKNKTLDHFGEDERKVLHRIAELFEDKDDLRAFEQLANREALHELAELVDNGTSIKELVAAYKGQKYLVSFLKGTAGLLAAGALIGGTGYALFKFMKG